MLIRGQVPYYDNLNYCLILRVYYAINLCVLPISVLRASIKPLSIILACRPIYL